MQDTRFSKVFRDSCRTIAKHSYGLKGLWVYDCFEFINHSYFADRLPYPLILWGITPHGGCIAWASSERERSRPPIITLHPTLWQFLEKQNPWRIPTAWLGPSLVFDALLHECIHVHIDCNLGGHKGPTTHNCKRWIRQVNRIAPLLGFKGVRAGISKTVRIPDPSAPRTPRGKVATKVVRRCVGNVPFHVIAGFPLTLRRYVRKARSHYEQNQLPPGAPAPPRRR